MKRGLSISILLVLAFMLSVLNIAAQNNDVDIALNDAGVIVNADGMTLYIFTNDTNGESTCYGGCAEAWPPVLVAEGESLTLADNVTGTFGTVAREDGARQVIYNGQPLYTFADDTVAGDTNGEGAGEVWFYARPATIALFNNDEQGTLLADANSMSLYTFTNDTDDESTCYDACATAWPPILVDSTDALNDIQIGISGEFDVTLRTDDTLQVTFNGLPLYTFSNDLEVGDTNGEGAGDVWFLARPAIITVVENETLGEILVAANGMTLYTFDNDTDSESTCYDACATAWAPLTFAIDEMPYVPETLNDEFSIIERTDGTFQAAYNGQPLYFWMNDSLPGDINGHMVGDVWFVAQPTG